MSRSETGPRSVLGGTRRPQGRYETRDVGEVGSSGSHRYYAAEAIWTTQGEPKNTKDAIIE
jgi:hypothetical protein